MHQSGPIIVYNDTEIYMSKMRKQAIWSSSYSYLNILKLQKCERNTLTTRPKILELSEQYWAGSGIWRSNVLVRNSTSNQPIDGADYDHHRRSSETTTRSILLQ